MGYVRCISEHGVYVKSDGGDVIILCLYVDDLLVTGNNENKVAEFKKRMMNTFEMTDLGEMIAIPLPVRRESVGVTPQV